MVYCWFKNKCVDMRLGKKLPGLLWSCSSALGECAWGYTRRIFDRTAGFSVALWVKYVSTQSSLMIKRRMVPALLVICSIFFLFVDPHKWPEIIMNQYFYVFAAFFIFNTLPQNFYSSSKLQKPSQDKKKKNQCSQQRKRALYLSCQIVKVKTICQRDCLF